MYLKEVRGGVLIWYCVETSFDFQRKVDIITRHVLCTILEADSGR